MNCRRPMSIFICPNRKEIMPAAMGKNITPQSAGLALNGTDGGSYPEDQMKQCVFTQPRPKGAFRRRQLPHCGTDKLNFSVLSALAQTWNRFSSRGLLLKVPVPAELHKD
jgi:hypothetical protein